MNMNIYSVDNKPMDMSKHRHFVSMQKRHRRLLMEISKDDEDYDFGWLHEYVVRKLRNMLEFYESGYAHVDFGTCQKIKEELREALVLADKGDRAKCFDDEMNWVAEFYKFIGEHISGWWS